MLVTSRMDEIRALMDERPLDPFPRYALALEYRNHGLVKEADRLFADLVSMFPSYVPTYLMYGQFLLAMKRPDDAKKVFEQGLVEARKVGNRHAQSELQQVLDDHDGWDST